MPLSPGADYGKLYWQLLTHAEQESAIRKMARSGMSAYAIAAATALSVEQIRVAVGSRKESSR